jgi:rhodanese-related sulfurtransferase
MAIRLTLRRSSANCGPIRPENVLCHEGYTGSLAARVLEELGLRNIIDMEGEYHAWEGAVLLGKL